MEQLIFEGFQIHSRQNYNWITRIKQHKEHEVKEMPIESHGDKRKPMNPPMWIIMRISISQLGLQAGKL